MEPKLEQLYSRADMDADRVLDECLVYEGTREECQAYLEAHDPTGTALYYEYGLQTPQVVELPMRLDPPTITVVRELDQMAYR